MGITIQHLELHTDARLDERGARALAHDIGRALDMEWRAAQRPDVQIDTLHLDLAASELARPDVAARVASAAMARIGQQGRGD